MALLLEEYHQRNGRGYEIYPMCADNVRRYSFDSRSSNCVEREAHNGGGMATGEENEGLAVSSYQCVGDELAWAKAQLLETCLFDCLGRMMTILCCDASSMS